MIKKKKMITIAVVAVMVTIFVVVMYQRSSESFGTRENGYMTVEEVVAYQKTCGDMQKKLGNDSLYPIYYSGAIKEKKNSNLEIKTIYEKTEAGLIKYQAIEWYAENHGIKVTENDVVRRMDGLIEELKTSDEYQQYQDAAKKLGTTYEAIIRNDYKTYYYAEVLNKVYTLEYDKYIQSGEMTQEEAAQQQQAFQKRWESFVNNVIREYQNSKAFDITNKELIECRSLSTKNVTAINEIKKAGL